jgi:hypothetical protein
MRLRFGTVDSVQDDRTITVLVGGSTEPIAGIRYAASMTPCAGKVILLLTDGKDLFAVDHLAAADLTLAPRAYRSTDQTIGDASDTAVTFDNVNSDAWGCWAGGSPTRLTAPVTGRYRFASHATGFRAGWILKGGSTTLARVNAISAASGSPTMFTVTAGAFDLTKGEYVELYVRQNSGGNLALANDGTAFPSLALTYLGP